MSIVKNPNPILRQKTLPIAAKDIVSPEIKKVVAELKKTIIETADAVGLAGPQIGVNKQIFAVKLPEEKEVRIFINPELLEASKRTAIDEEGCLSMPRLFGTVSRARTVTVKALDEHGKKIKIRAKGLLARVLQHEIDHLSGRLFIDKAERTFKLT